MARQMEEYVRACRAIEQKIPVWPETAVVLGSGLGFMAELVEDRVEFPYSQIPGFPVSTVATHAGKMVCGRLADKAVLLMNGRYHYYEGHSMEDVVFPIRVLHLLGVRNLLLTNAAGGINREFSAGGVMLITDHIKLMGDSPLRGLNLDEFGVRFPDMTHAYSPRLLELARQVAREQNIDLKEGVYAYAAGPQYETPAEVRTLGIWGADAVGMSTVPEVIAAHHCGMEVMGISCITNMAAGITGQPLNDEEVNRVAHDNRDKLSALIQGVLQKI